MDRITGRVPAAGDDIEEISWMESRIEDRISDLEERIEFAERMLDNPDNKTKVMP